MSAAAPQSLAPQTPASIHASMPPMSQQQEDSIIHTRITNDEKALRKVTKKFYAYTSVAYNGAVPVSPESSTSIDDARDAFLLDLASFNLSLKKSLMVCEAEARQIEEYQRERERIENEHESLSGQIESLKISLEQAHLQRRRKIEYDVIAEKINTLPSREELEQSITAIENDMLAIQAEHDNQNNVLQSQQAALETVISSIQELRRLGKEDVDINESSHNETPAPDSQTGGDDDVDMEPRARAETGEIPDDTGEGHELSSANGSASFSKILNPAAKAFIPQSSSPSTPLLRSSAGTPLPPSDSQTKSELEEGEDDDIEMGELAEEPIEKVKKPRQELEEGEASDLSSELSEPPDD